MIQFLASLGFSPQKKGREYKFPCPFHDDDDPSFGVNVNKAVDKGGIFHCFPCGWSGDVFDFVAQTQGLDGFISALNFMAGRLGLGGGGNVRQTSKPVAPRQSQGSQTVVMTAEDVDEDWERCKHAAIDHTEACRALRVRPDALPIIDGCVCKMGGQHPVMVIPMRDPYGALTSLRFRSMGPKQPKMDKDGKPKLGSDGKPKLRTVRWSLNRRKGDTVTHESRSGLMAPYFQFEEAPRPTQMSMAIEGETDLLGGISMMLDLGIEDPTMWPARWWGLPGVGSCHEMLTPELLGGNATLLFDPDAAGQGAVFDRRRMVKDEFRGGKHMRPDLDAPMRDGLLKVLRERGIQAVAAFPPMNGDQKQDVRDVYGAGWDWARLEDYVMRSAMGMRV